MFLKQCIISLYTVIYPPNETEQSNTYLAVPLKWWLPNSAWSVLRLVWFKVPKGTPILGNLHPSFFHVFSTFTSTSPPSTETMCFARCTSASAHLDRKSHAENSPGHETSAIIWVCGMRQTLIFWAPESEEGSTARRQTNTSWNFMLMQTYASIMLWPTYSCFWL